MLRRSIARFLCTAALVNLTSAFAPVSLRLGAAQSSSLLLAKSHNDNKDIVVVEEKPVITPVRNGALPLVATAILMTHILAAPTMAMAAALSWNDFSSFDSQVLLAGRASGGRMGGRSSSGGYRAPSSSSSYSRTYHSSTTIIRPVVTTPPVVVTPSIGFGYSPFYNPMGGFGLGYGLGAMGSAGDAIRDYQQESEIQRSKAELEVAKSREAELEQRVRALERAQLQPQ